jgi:hypothetical protein
VLSGLDQRATLMLRHIPNKYSQRMLLCLLEKNHRGKFDLLYLPIDSKNKSDANPPAGSPYFLPDSSP